MAYFTETLFENGLFLPSGSIFRMKIE